MPRGTTGTTRRRRRRRSTRTAGANGAATSLLSQITSLVTQNEALTRQNRDLQASLDAVRRAVGGGGTTAGRGRRPGRAARATAARPVGRPRARRRPLSPETLAKRRAGLAKARAVLAAKRAAAKKGRS